MKLERMMKEAALYERYITDPVVVEELPEAEQQDLYRHVNHLKIVVESKDEKRLEAELREVANYQERLYQGVLRKKQNEILFLWGFNLGWSVVRVGGVFAAGFLTGLVCPPAAIGGMALYGAADMVGDQGAKLVLEKDYTLATAGKNALYHSPFLVAKGLGFQSAKPLIGGSVFVGTTFVEALGDPKYLQASWKSRFDYARFHAGAALLFWFAGDQIAGNLYPAFWKKFGKLPDAKIPVPAILKPKPKPAPVIVKVVEAPKPLPPPREPAPPIHLAPERELPVHGIRERRPTPVAPAPAMPSRPNYTVVKTELAEGAHSQIPEVARNRLDGLVGHLKIVLNEGHPITSANNIKPIRRGGRFLCWEGVVTDGPKPRVYFEIVGDGNGGPKQIRILGYSIGYDGQERMLSLIEKMLR
ncbi:MAG: hypothetical protein Q7T03_01330 [Deltaproteobacteria bacterium]|nr:hypothetical protein [Deltaproteobacteria bacterium]